MVETSRRSAPDARLAFGAFVLEIDERRLLRDGRPVELSGRYLDALILLASEPGRLVTKGRFLDQVWAGVPVTEEALTQCVRSLRRALDDDAARPRFIETVPKQGYRFVAEVTSMAPADPAAPAVAASDTWRRLWLRTAAGMIGGGLAGLVGGIAYGLIVGSGQGLGSSSVLVVLAGLTLWVGLLGGAGVGFGIALADRARPRLSWRSALGGALGGMITGGLVKLVGVDAFALLFGQAPERITGAGEGLLLGSAIGLAAWAADRRARLRWGLGVAALVGSLSGLAVVALGGRLMAGSLLEVATRFPMSRLSLQGPAALLSQPGSGPLVHAVTAAFEAALFTAVVVGALILARRSLERT